MNKSLKDLLLHKIIKVYVIHFFSIWFWAPIIYKIIPKKIRNYIMSTVIIDFYDRGEISINDIKIFNDMIDCVGGEKIAGIKKLKTSKERLFRLQNDKIVKVISACNVKGCLLTYTNNATFRIYDEKHNFVDYDIRHYDPDIKFIDYGVYFYDDGEKQWIDYCPEALGLEEIKTENNISIDQ